MGVVSPGIYLGIRGQCHPHAIACCDLSDDLAGEHSRGVHGHGIDHIDGTRDAITQGSFECMAAGENLAAGAEQHGMAQTGGRSRDKLSRKPTPGVNGHRGVRVGE